MDNLSAEKNILLAGFNTIYYNSVVDYFLGHPVRNVYVMTSTE